MFSALPCPVVWHTARNSAPSPPPSDLLPNAPDAGILESNIELSFTPSLKSTSYNISIASDTVLTLSLLPGKKWANPSTADGMTL